MPFGKLLGGPKQSFTSSRVYVLDPAKNFQTAYFMLRGDLPVEGKDGVIDVLEKAANSALVHKTVIPKGVFCNTIVRVTEEYCHVDEDGQFSEHSPRQDRGAFMRRMIALSERRGAEAVAEEIRKQVSEGKIARFYRIEGENGRLRSDDEVKRFVFYLDILRMLTFDNFIGLSTKEAGAKVPLPFIPVSGLSIYTERDIDKFIKAHDGRQVRAGYAQEIRKQTGERPDIWDDSLWAEDNQPLVVDAYGQRRPMSEVESGQPRKRKVEDIKQYGNDMNLVDTDEDWPYVKKDTKRSLINELANMNAYDRTAAARCYFELFCLSFGIASQALKKAQPKKIKELLCLPDMIERLPKVFINYILFDMELSSKQEADLYDVQNIPLKSQRHIASKFRLKHYEELRKYLPFLMRHEQQQLLAERDLSDDERQLVQATIDRIIQSLADVDLTEFERKMSKLDPHDPDEDTIPAEQADGDDQSQTNQTDDQKGGDQQNKSRRKQGTKDGDDSEDEQFEIPDDAVLKSAVLIVRASTSKADGQNNPAPKGQGNGGRRRKQGDRKDGRKDGQRGDGPKGGTKRRRTGEQGDRHKK